MKKYIIWILGIATWLFIFTMFTVVDTYEGNHTHQLILIITGICLAIYIWKRTGSGAKELEKENQQLKAEIQKLQRELQDQAVRHAMEKAENREKKN